MEREADDVEVRKVEHAAKFEVDRGVRVIEADSIIEQCIRADQARSGHAGALDEEVHLVFRKVDNSDVGQEQWSVVHAVHAHEFPVRFFCGTPQVGRTYGAGHVRPIRMGGSDFLKQFLRKKTDTGAQVEGEIVFLVLNLAGNLDQAVLRIDQDLSAWSPEMNRAGDADGKLVIRKID